MEFTARVGLALDEFSIQPTNEAFEKLLESEQWVATIRSRQQKTLANLEKIKPKFQKALTEKIEELLAS